ncbi:MAG TPA: hypothetical protein VFP91_11210, partial [Vicinamibacterales bacterium]|nr:hypothetical protein [Vicinamibacterales bacterium]
MACSGALNRGTPNNPFRREQPKSAVAPPTSTPSGGNQLEVGAWLDSSKATAPFTTFVTYWLSCDEDPASVESQIDPSD